MIECKTEKNIEPKNIDSVYTKGTKRIVINSSQDLLAKSYEITVLC
jgi:hypothetical protein